MKRIKKLTEFKVGEKYLFISKLGNKSLGISTELKDGFAIFRIYQSTYKDLPSGTECCLDEFSFKDGKSYLLTENEFLVELL